MGEEKKSGSIKGRKAVKHLCIHFQNPPGNRAQKQLLTYPGLAA